MSAQSAPTDKLIGQVLASRYEILHRLGEGAMGVVYKARHVKVGRTFAVKVLHARLLTDSKIAQRFAREAELAGRLRHANVVGVVDVGEIDDMHYMVMDFAEGPDLAQLLAEAPMPPARIIGLVRQMLEGLYHAHEQGLIHRDFKPENVIVERDSHGAEMPRIVDFGIALLREGGDSTDGEGRLTTNGLVLGTPHYMAPEQAVADPIDHRIDLFALGIVIYEMLSGRLPFDGSGAEVARANLLLDPPPISRRVPYLEVDPLLEAFSRHLMAKKRSARPANANAARELLDLIDRDRRAAAIALGISPELSIRAPALTVPVTRHDDSGPRGDRTTPMRPTPVPTRPSDRGVPTWAAPNPSEPVPSDAPRAGRSYLPSDALPIVGGSAPARPARSAPADPGPAPNYTLPGPPIVFSAMPQAPGVRGMQDDDTALRTPLGWPPARPHRRTAWILGGMTLAAAAVISARLLTQSAPRTAARTEPHVDLRAIAERPVDPVAPTVVPPSIPPSNPTPVPTPVPTSIPPSVTTEVPTTAPATVPPAETTPAPTAIAPEPATPAPAQPAADPDLAVRKPPAPPTRVATRPKPRTVSPPPARPAVSRVNEATRRDPPVVDRDPTRVASPPEPAPTKIVDSKPVAPAPPRPCDTTAPPVAGISASAISSLYYKVPVELGLLGAGKAQDLWGRFTRYNVQELMRAPQATREQAAIALWQIVKEAGCRRTR